MPIVEKGASKNANTELNLKLNDEVMLEDLVQKVEFLNFQQERDDGPLISSDKINHITLRVVDYDGRKWNIHTA